VLPLLSQDSILSDGDLNEAEFSVAINPTDSNNIVLATIYGVGTDNGSGDSDSDYLKIYYTNDFGETWQLSNFHGVIEGYKLAGDPVLSFDENGNLFLINLSLDENFNSIPTFLSNSLDGGATWSSAAILKENSFSDKPWMAIDRYGSSPFKGNIYIPLVLNDVRLICLDNELQIIHDHQISDGNHLPSVVVKKNGDVFTSTVQLGIENEVFVQKYANGGADFSHSSSVVSFPDYTFNAPDISTRFQPTVYLAIDNSEGIYEGRIYLSYTASEENNADYFDIFLSFSDDDGLTWSVPKIVHTDQQDQVQQFYSSIYVNDSGVLILDWYDRGNYENTNKLTDFFMGISYDGGETFTELQLNSLSTDFEEIIEFGSGFGIGEYHQCIATNNTAISFWSDGRTNDGDLNIYFAKVSLQDPTTGVEELSVISTELSISLPYPQPVTERVFIDIDLKVDTKLKYEIVNNTGVKIWISNWLSFKQGNHTLEIPVNVAAGVYYLRVVAENGYFKSRKIIKL